MKLKPRQIGPNEKPPAELKDMLDSFTGQTPSLADVWPLVDALTIEPYWATFDLSSNRGWHAFFRIWSPADRSHVSASSGPHETSPAEAILHAARVALDTYTAQPAPVEAAL